MIVGTQLNLLFFLEFNPIPTKEVCENYNALRNEIVLLSELKAACNASEIELQSLKNQFKTLNPNGVCISEYQMTIDISA